ncbi:MAG: carboxylating nicotinate-nucleotide diphosphorylase [Sulfurospirillaceae bacterium]|nr:carboxylating nicotinate-nucleotide diphosphorylase [Sulfurospirillaceae bacterium]
MIKKFVKNALQEDIGRGDLFYLVGDNKKSTAKIISKDCGILAGTVYVKALCKIENIDIKFNIKDGEGIFTGDVIAILKGKSKKLLMCERTILNLLQHASGIATNTNKYVQQIKDYDIKLLDTRKTRPFLRIFEKYAVRCGGGNNHRMGLDDCLMLKDTHIKTIENLEEFLKTAKNKLPYTSKIEIECESVEFAKYAMQCGADMIMCDNMELTDIKEVVEYKNKNFSYILVEASGNITKDNIKEYAETKVDAISSGSLIHQATWLDLSMKII